MINRSLKQITTLSVLLAAGGCGQESLAPELQALFDVKAYIQSNLDDLDGAVSALQSDAPVADADGWNAKSDAAAVAKMKADWKRARIAYEHIEGALAVLFPDLDASTDERYDGFISTSPDDYLFDDKGVIGVHAIERILWSAEIPVTVKNFEQGLPGYKEAAFPSSHQEALDFKNKLCARLVADVKTMRSQFAPLALDPAAAFRGVIGSMNEQLEKASKAATGEEESRYAQYTLADMRANIEAGEQTYSAFRACWTEGERRWMSRSMQAFSDSKSSTLPILVMRYLRFLQPGARPVHPQPISRLRLDSSISCSCKSPIRIAPALSST